MIIKTLCPFCSFGCEFGVVFDDFGIRGVEYTKDSPNNGRLCPRGSASPSYLNHPRRLAAPMRDGQWLNWDKLHQELKKILVGAKGVAVTFDRNLTIEEYGAITGFCNKFGIENFASTYFEPERLLHRFLDCSKPITLAEIKKAQMIIVVGDIFNQSPVISKTLINWKLSERTHRLVVIDSTTTHTSYFANDFIKVKPGTEPCLLFSLAQERIEGLELSGVSGVDEAVVDNLSRDFKEVERGYIIVSFGFARTYDPLLFVEGISKFSDFSGKRVVPFFEFVGFEGNCHFGVIMDLIKKRRIRYLLNFGELFPFYYPQIAKELKGVAIYSLSPLRQDSYTILPAALNLEKRGTVITTFGRKGLNGGIEPASGAKNVHEILGLFADPLPSVAAPQLPRFKLNIKERFRRLVERDISIGSKKKRFKLFGEKIAYNFMSFFEEEMVKMNPLDAKEWGIKNGEVVGIASQQGRAEFKTRLTQEIDPGYLVLPAESPKSKGLFDFEIEERMVNFIPTWVEIWPSR